MTKYNFSRQSSYYTYNLKEGSVTVFERERRSSDFAAQIADNKTTKRDGQSFFVMDAGRVTELLDIWFNHLPRVQPFYSLNCNSDPVLLRVLAANSSVGFNCGSGRDLKNALDYVPSSRVMCSYPCWTHSALLQTEEQNVALLCFDNDRDLDRILTNHPDAKLLLRVCVNPDSEDPNALFGASLEKVAELLQLSIDLGLNCVGIAFNVGSDSVCPSSYERAIEWSAHLFRLGISMGLKMSVLNIGGGFISPSNDRQYTHFIELCNEVNRSLDVHFPSNGFGCGLCVVATPDCFFVGSVFSLVTSVIGKRCTDASFVTNNEFDAGNDAFLYQINDSSYGSFGCRMMTNCEPPHCVPLFDASSSDIENVYGAIFGTMGFDVENDMDADVVQSVCHFRQLNVGDWLLWSNMGAYTLDNSGCLEENDVRLPNIFYFSSRKNWEHLSRKLFTVVEKRSVPTDELYLSDAESEGSCGEPMGQSESEAEVGEPEESE